MSSSVSKPPVASRTIRFNEYSPLRIQDVQVWVMAEWYSAPTVTQLLVQSAVNTNLNLTSKKAIGGENGKYRSVGWH